MAVKSELLVCAKSNMNSGGYRRGDIAVVKEPGWKWGTLETLPTFFILKLDVPVDKVEAYLASEYVLQNPEFGIIWRRAWGFLVDNVPSGVKAEIVATGEYTATVAEIKQYVRNKTTDAEADFNV